MSKKAPMLFDSWWIEFRGFDDPTGKPAANLAFDAGVAFERERIATIFGDNYGWNRETGEYEDDLGDAIRRGEPS